MGFLGSVSGVMTRHEEVFLEDFNVTDSLESKAETSGNANITALKLVLALSFPKASVAQRLPKYRNTDTC